jgi:hypothetical protein
LIVGGMSQRAPCIELGRNVEKEIRDSANTCPTLKISISWRGNERDLRLWRTYRRRDQNRSSKIGPMTETAVKAPYATAAHPIVLRMVDLFSFMIRILFLSAPLLRRYRQSLLFVPSSLTIAQTSQPDAVVDVYIYLAVLPQAPFPLCLLEVSLEEQITQDIGRTIPALCRHPTPDGARP